MIVDLAALAANASAWRAFAGGRRLYAVVKADAYGIGTARMVRTLEDRVDAWCVTSLEEARAVREISCKRIICIAALPEEHVVEAVALDVEPSVARCDDVRLLERIAARRGTRVRAQLAVRSVAGWIGVAPRDTMELAQTIVASRGVEIVEAWTHLSGENEAQEQLAALLDALASAKGAGVEIPSVHAASTAPTLWLDGNPPGDAVRIGIGLFGSLTGRSAPRVPALEQVLHVGAVVERSEQTEAGVGVGYGQAYTTKSGDHLVTARFGYSHGMPRTFASSGISVISAAGELPVVAMGMQFLTCLGRARVGETLEVLGPRRPLDRVAAAAGVLPHELVLSLAHAARAAGTLVDRCPTARYTTCGASR